MRNGPDIIIKNDNISVFSCIRFPLRHTFYGRIAGFRKINPRPAHFFFQTSGGFPPPMRDSALSMLKNTNGISAV